MENSSSKKQNICFIINPFSGISKKGGLAKKIEKHLDHQQFNYELKYTKYAGHATTLSKEAVAQNFDLVVAVGGDGSVNEVAAGLIDTNVVLGIIPAGSGNGFARHLGISTRPHLAIQQLNQGNVDQFRESAHELSLRLVGIPVES
ncbi:MAG TPA: hypothetical protein ENJ53_02715, partial [Phaeodactylibacter sp.]|nr:hypothetical protein [Phaeodactylibacter sp.]